MLGQNVFKMITNDPRATLETDVLGGGVYKKFFQQIVFERLLPYHQL